MKIFIHWFYSRSINWQNCALVPVMASCRQVTGHDLIRSWYRSMTFYGATKTQYVETYRLTRILSHVILDVPVNVLFIVAGNCAVNNAIYHQFIVMGSLKINCLVSPWYSKYLFRGCRHYWLPIFDWVTLTGLTHLDSAPPVKKSWSN